MAGNHVLSISSVCSFFKNNMKQFKRGEIAYKDGHILKFQADLEQNIVVGDVKRSIKSDPYKVRILLNDGSISDPHYSCTRGVAICHHIAALALYIHYNLSSTDKACSCSARPVNVSSNVSSINDMYGTYNTQNTSIAEVDIENFKNTTRNLSVPVGFTWLLKPEPKIKEAEFVLSSIKSFVQDCKNMVKLMIMKQ